MKENYLSRQQVAHWLPITRNPGQNQAMSKFWICENLVTVAAQQVLPSDFPSTVNYQVHLSLILFGLLMCHFGHCRFGSGLTM